MFRWKGINIGSIQISQIGIIVIAVIPIPVMKMMHNATSQLPEYVVSFNKYFQIFQIVYQNSMILSTATITILLLIFCKKQPVKSRFIAPYFGLAYLFFKYLYRYAKKVEQLNFCVDNLAIIFQVLKKSFLTEELNITIL